MSRGAKEVAKDLDTRLVNNGKGVKGVKKQTTIIESK